jgi:glycosyltransferase involved in cell wall biosynthesis
MAQLEERALRLLQVIHSLNPDHGGPPEGARQICRAFRSRGVIADIASLDTPEVPWGCDCGVIHLGPARWGKYGYNERLLGWMRLNARNYDAVVVHGLWQYHSLATWRALNATGTPYFVFPHGMLDPWFKNEYPLKHLKKLMYWPWAEYRVLRDAQAVLFTTEEERQLARSSFGRYQVNEAVVGYGIAGPPDHDREALRMLFLQAFPQLYDKRVLLFLGRLHPKKGCDLLIDAFAKVAQQEPSLHLVMAGPDHGDYQAELVRQAEQLGVSSRICWTGMLKNEMKWAAFHSAEAFVLPSHQENFGISVAEALACGTPVLISNKVNIWREIDAAQAGLVADDTLEGTTWLLQTWLGFDAAERERVRRNGPGCFSKHFHIDGATSNLLTTIKASLRETTRADRCRQPHTSAA